MKPKHIWIWWKLDNDGQTWFPCLITDHPGGWHGRTVNERDKFEKYEVMDDGMRLVKE